MACLSVNRMDPVKKMEKVLVTKKQQSMSNYNLLSSALELQCRCYSLSDCKVIAAVQDMVATLFDIHERVVSSSCHAVPRGHSVD